MEPKQGLFPVQFVISGKYRAAHARSLDDVIPRHFRAGPLLSARVDVPEFGRAVYLRGSFEDVTYRRDDDAFLLQGRFVPDVYLMPEERRLATQAALGAKMKVLARDANADARSRGAKKGTKVLRGDPLVTVVHLLR